MSRRPTLPFSIDEPQGIGTLETNVWASPTASAGRQLGLKPKPSILQRSRTRISGSWNRS